jgi:hypothetical protein
MRFLTIWRPADPASVEGGRMPSQEEMAAMGRLIQDMAEAGVLLATDGLLPSSYGARVRRDKGRITVTDGPFTETKELIGGFAIIRAASKAEAIEHARRFLAVAGDGESEVRQMPDEPAFTAG